MREPLEQLLRTLDYQFSNPDLINTALTHRSVGRHNNERLEFLGDAILGFVIADELYARFPDANEGELSRLRAKLVKKESLATIARELELGNYLHLGPGELRSGGHSRDSILADAFEAVLAAIYLDDGYQATRNAILRFFNSHLDRLSDRAFQKDPKTQLQEMLQAKKLSLPKYKIVDVSGAQHDQVFSVTCTVAGFDRSTTGTGSSRRNAEQAAAQQFLEYLANG
ncbi:MAG: ribonuclease III [Chromatiales bacterium]|nr:ribonuclease III [Chromatiales bacterium]